MRYMIRLSVALLAAGACAAVSLAQVQVEIRARATMQRRVAISAESARGGIHIPAGRRVSSPWTTTDSHGYLWDILNNAAVSDGTNDAYDGGMQLQVNGVSFPSQFTARLSADGKEVEVGPWLHGNLNISRRIFVNTKAGYCRWIDIFENTTGNEITVSLRYYSNMGAATGRTQTTSGSADLTSMDWGVVTSGAQGSNRPAVVHVFATPAARFKPTFSFTKNSDSLYYNAAIKVPPRKAVALCFFEAQRKSFDEAVGFLKDFDPADELRLVPRSLRTIVLNMADGGVTTLGEVDLKRDKKSDLLILRNGSEIRGEIINRQYVLKTDFGQVKIPAGAVIALTGRSPANDRVHLVMTDGQIIAGELTSGPMAIKLADGTQLEIAPKEVLQATCRISPAKPETITIADPMAVFRSGARLAFDSSGTDFTFRTTHGVIKPSAGNLRAIEMDTPAGGLHRLVFRNGSTLAGLLEAERISLKLKLGSATLTAGSSTIEVARRRLKRFVFSAEPIKSKCPARLTFRNTDIIFGHFANESLTVSGKIGPLTVLCRDIARAEFNVAAPGQVKLTMRDGTSLAGRLADDYVKFKIEPGPELNIFTGHIQSITGEAAPPPKATTQPAVIPPPSHARHPRPASRPAAAPSPPSDI